MWQIVIKFGLWAVVLMILLQLSKYSWLTYGLRSEVLITAFAAFFLVLGVFVSRMVFKRKTLKTSDHQPIDPRKVEKLSISKREYEVLQQMAAGKSNSSLFPFVC